MKRKIILLSCLLTTLLLPATVYKVASVEAFDSAVKKLVPGDSIVLANQKWNNAELKFKAKGTKEHPIVLTAETPGLCTLEGISNIRLSGDYLIVDGLVFINGHAPEKKVVIDFRTSKEDFANNSIVRNCVIDHYNQADKTIKDHWVEIWGKNNRVEYCYFAGKKNLGTTLVIWPNGDLHAPNYHKVYRNYFGIRPPLGSNGGETIRIGTSTYSMVDSYSIIEENYFEHCNGETEIVSVKSGRNKIINNTFFECEGSIVLRHGNNNEVSGNYILGNGKRNTGGIRIINAGHTIYNNYLSGIRGKDFRNPLVIMNGVPNSPINRYHKVQNVQIVHNTFMDCGTAMHLCVGSDSERTDIPENVTIANNVVYSTTADKLVAEYDNTKGFKFSNNLFIGSNGIQTDYNGIQADFQLLRTKEGFDFIFPNTVNNDFSFVETDINAKKREDGKQIGAIQSEKGRARRLIPTQLNCGPRYKWNKVKEDNSNNAKAYHIVPGLNTLQKAIKKTSEGDTIVLAAGEYVNEKKISIKHNLTICTEKDIDTRPIIIVDDKESNTISVFEIKNGATVQFNNLSIKGKDDNTRQAKYGIYVAGENTLDHYNLYLSNCDFSDFLQEDGAVIAAKKGTFIDTLYLGNCLIANAHRGIALDREKDDKGLYNVENIILFNTTFNNIAQWALSFYRGGNDESTLGGLLYIDHCTFQNINNKEGQFCIKQTGLVTYTIKNSLFMDAPFCKGPIKTERSTHSITNCCILNAGKINKNKNASIQNIFYSIDKIEGNATDGKNIGLIF